MNTYIKKIISNIKLNPTYEEHNSIAFLDLTIKRRHTKLEVDVYRKPTTTDTTINFLSNHPIEQKMAAFRFHITRMHSLPLNPDKKQAEWEIIQSIAKNNNFPQHRKCTDLALFIFSSKKQFTSNCTVSHALQLILNVHPSKTRAFILSYSGIIFSMPS